MKLLVVTRRYPPVAGGAEHQLEIVAEALAARGHHVHVLTGRHRPDLPVREDGRGVVVERLAEPPMRVLGTAIFLTLLAVRMLHLRRRYDCVVASMVNETSSMAVFLARWLGRPTVLRFGNAALDFAWSQRRRLGRLYAHAARRAGRYVGQTAAYVSQAERHAIPSEQVRIIPNAYAPRFMDARPGKCPASVDRKPSIVWCGRLDPQKDPLLLCDAVARLQEIGVITEAVVLGDGALRGAVENRIRERGLTAMIRLEGHVDDVLPHLRKADVLCLTSKDEGMPNVLLEAMAACVPVVATAVGGVPEVIEDGVTGLLVPPGNAEAMAGALQRLIEDDCLRARLADTACACVREHHDPDKIVAQWEALLREVSNLREPVS